MAKKGLWTSEEMSYFSERVYYWIEQFGLFDWYVETSYTYDKDDWAASCTRDAENRNAGICFNTAQKKPPKNWIKKTLDSYALHEVLHLLLADLGIAAKKNQLEDTVEHQIIRRLEKYILGMVR